MGELLVQARLLQFGIHATPAIKDSGSDLIAVRGESFRVIQVRTRSEEPFTLEPLSPLYHILALVCLKATDRDVLLDQSTVYMIPKELVDEASISSFRGLEEYAMHYELLDRLFAG